MKHTHEEKHGQLTILAFDDGGSSPYEVCEIHGAQRLYVKSFATRVEAESFIKARSTSTSETEQQP